MNSIHNNGENDQSLSEGLDKLGRAYEHLPDDEPPELLDQAILNRAHRAVEKTPHWMTVWLASWPDHRCQLSCWQFPWSSINVNRCRSLRVR